MNLLAVRHPLDVIVDRPRREAARAVAAAWLAFMAGLLIGGEVGDPASVVVAGSIGAALVFVGFATASRCRLRAPDGVVTRVRLALLSLALGVALGVGNLLANRAIAEADPTLRALLVQRFATLDPLDAVIASPLVEEIAVRLFLMSVMAWIVSRFTKRATATFAIALAGSAVFFALLHLARPLPMDPELANYYRASLVAKYTVSGVALGWIFWRWGLPYAILSHAIANAAHILLEERFF